LPFRASVKSNKQKAGEMVKEFIEDTKKEIQKTKKRMSEGLKND